MNYIKLVTGALLVATEVSGTANAQPAQENTDGWRISVGGGLFSSPNYTGDDDRQLMLVPSVKASYGRHWEISLPEGIQYTFNPESELQWGIALAPSMGRDSDGSNPFRISGDDTKDLLGLDEIDTAIGLKLNAEYKVDAWSLKASAQQNVGKNAFTTLTMGLSRSGMIKGYGPPLILSGGFSFQLGNEESIRSLVGVTQQQSVATGLQPYSPGAGLVSYGVNGFAMLPISSSLRLIGTLSVQQLADNLADSSLVKERGDDVQVSGGLFLSYQIK